MALLSWLVVVLTLLALSDPAYLGVLLVPSSAFPLIITQVLTARCVTVAAQRTLSWALWIYGFSFLLVTGTVAFLDRGSQSGLALLFVGLWSLPLLLPLWILVIVQERRLRAVRAP